LGSRHFVFLGTIVEAFVSRLFEGMRMRGFYQFRVTRNSDLFVEQEEVDDLLGLSRANSPRAGYGRLPCASETRWPGRNIDLPARAILLERDDLTRCPDPSI